MSRRSRVDSGAVERVLAEDAERDLVGDRLADQRAAGIEQPLYRPGVSARHRVGARPVRIAATGRMASDIEQILGCECQPRERTAGATLDTKALLRHEGAEIFCHHRPPLVAGSGTTPALAPSTTR